MNPETAATTAAVPPVDTTVVSAQQAASSWPDADASVDSMAHIAADLDDLSNIFNIADFDLETIQAVDNDQYGDHVQDLQASTDSASYVGGLVQQPLHASVAHDFADSSNNHTTHLVGDETPHHPQHTQNQKFASNQTFSPHNWQQQFSAQQSQLFGNAPQDHFVAGSHIPPTPNSYEMHGETAHFLQQQHPLYAQQKHMNSIDPHSLQALQHANRAAHFTPLTSPSGTPQYAMQPEFTTPGAYFSPLTSPALHAQMQPNANNSAHAFSQPHAGYFTNPSTAPSSNAPSPVDLNSADIDMIDSNATAEPASKKSKRKLVTPRSVAPASTRVRQSPIQKPQKRKSGLVTSIVTARDIESLSADSQPSANRTLAPSAAAATRMSQAFDSSESGSISPEPLSEALMRPPPRPGSNAQSPALQQHIAIPSNVAATLSQKAAAATPKSILSMRGDATGRMPSPKMSSPDSSSLLATPTVNGFGQISLDDLELPEAAATKQPSRRSSTVVRNGASIARGDSGDGSMQDVLLPIDTSRKTPKLGPSSTPSSARPESAAGDSPSVMVSPALGSTPAGLLKQQKKIDGKSSSRSAKKRGSVSTTGSAMASPALRPRISPSIKPLLPEGSSLHSPTHALLLASKSNYQNLLEGNHLPGVNYPDSLSTGLTSKRTSHKVAEQGRRNRINEALKEMQSLIPSPTLAAKSGLDDGAPMKDEDDSPDAAGGDGDNKDGKDNSSKSNSSKAATVESANRYIRMLKESELSQRAAIQALKQENEEMRKKLAEATGGKALDGDTLATTEMPPIQESDDSCES